MPPSNDDVPLLRLPLELSTEIYKLVLEDALPEGYVQLSKDKSVLKKPAIMQVCRQIRLEADHCLKQRIMAYADELDKTRACLAQEYACAFAKEMHDAFEQIFMEHNHLFLRMLALSTFNFEDYHLGKNRLYASDSEFEAYRRRARHIRNLLSTCCNSLKHRE